MSRLIAGVLLVVVCVGGALWWSTRTQDRIQVLAIARPVAVGHLLEPADLRSVDISASEGVETVPAAQAETVLGRPMATSLNAGALLTADAIGAASIPRPGYSIAAVGLKPGQYPPELSTGAPVVVVAASTSDTTSAANPSPGMSWSGTVIGVTASGNDQTTVVSLELPSVAASQLAKVPAGDVAVVIQPAVGGGR